MGPVALGFIGGFCQQGTYTSSLKVRTYDISEQGHDGRIEQCWDEKFVEAEQLVEVVAVVEPAEPGEGTAV